MVVNKIKCRSCKTHFEPIYRNGIIVSRLCLSCLSAKAKKKVNSDKAKEKKQAKDKLKTKSEWLLDLQKIFNEFIRLRDRGKTCISCENILSGKYDSGHYFTVGAYPNLRVNEDNAHGQCVWCNQHKHGNISEYSLNLPKRIGKERFESLLSIRNEPLNLSIPEIKSLIVEYKQKVKSLKCEEKDIR